MPSVAINLCTFFEIYPTLGKLIKLPSAINRGIALQALLS